MPLRFVSHAMSSRLVSKSFCAPSFSTRGFNIPILSLTLLGLILCSKIGLKETSGLSSFQTTSKGSSSRRTNLMPDFCSSFSKMSASAALIKAAGTPTEESEDKFFLSHALSSDINLPWALIREIPVSASCLSA